MPAKGQYKNLTGRKFDRLVVVRLHTEEVYRRKWWCRCRCGNELPVLTDSLVSNRTRSCGCRRREACKLTHTKHGRYNTAEYRVWCEMKRRCEDETRKCYKDYGARGIKVCARWHTFDNFYADMGPRPTPKHTVERKDNNVGYEPCNCVWATMTSQARNTRRTVFVTVNGSRVSLAEAVEGSGVKYATALYRFHKGYSVEQILRKNG